jgi:tRNA threonylcarbamoyladenosine biosynthesis protein TsaE
MDLYRLKQPEEALEIGLEEALSDALCLIEWPSRLGSLLPEDRIELAFSEDGEARRVQVRGFGAGVRRVEELMDA